MAEYLPYKTKEFKLQKDAITWTKSEKKKYGGNRPVRIETNYKPGNPFPWEGVVLLRSDE